MIETHAAAVNASGLFPQDACEAWLKGLEEVNQKGEAVVSLLQPYGKMCGHEASPEEAAELDEMAAATAEEDDDAGELLGKDDTDTETGLDVVDEGVRTATAEVPATSSHSRTLPDGSYKTSALSNLVVRNRKNKGLHVRFTVKPELAVGVTRSPHLDADCVRQNSVVAVPLGVAYGRAENAVKCSVLAVAKVLDIKHNGKSVFELSMSDAASDDATAQLFILPLQVSSDGSSWTWKASAAANGAAATDEAREAAAQVALKALVPTLYLRKVKYQISAPTQLYSFEAQELVQLCNSVQVYEKLHRVALPSAPTPLLPYKVKCCMASRTHTWNSGIVGMSCVHQFFVDCMRFEALSQHVCM